MTDSQAAFTANPHAKIETIAKQSDLVKQEAIPPITQLSFLQNFVAQSIKLANYRAISKIHNEEPSKKPADFVQTLGLTASGCLEDMVKSQLGYKNTPINLEQYTDIILTVKKQIGGCFSRLASSDEQVNVTNSQCPFGHMVKEVPELCQMTSSVFGGIAARNFGYAKVELKKRIALGDNCCDVRIYIDQKASEKQAGDEYFCEGENIVSKASGNEVCARISEKLKYSWYQGRSKKNAMHKAPNIIASSRIMEEILKTVELVAATPVTVLIAGETGVGKEIIARSIHAMSNRHQSNFIAVNCGAIPENLIESMLFGHEKGAFTNAYNVHLGYFERAENGTLFLDEIDSLPLSAQAKLLRVLQENEFERVGGRQTIQTDVRVLVASNCSIRAMVEQGKFRKDLFYRLNVVPIHIPPLKERREDMAELANYFLRRLAEKYQRAPHVLGDRAWQQMMRYDWPGNVRELENVLERSFIFSPDTVIHNLLIEIDENSQVTDFPSGESLSRMKKRVAHELESRVLQEALKRLSGNVSAVARELDITPRAIHQKIKLHQLDIASFR